MATTSVVAHFGAGSQPDRPARPRASFVIFAALFAAALVSLWPGFALAAYDPFVMVLMPEREGKPNQQIVRYEVKPDAAHYLVDGGQYIDTSAFEKLRDAAISGNQNQLRALALEEGWGWYSLSAGWTGAAGTFAENALEFTSLSRANTALTNIGGVLTVLQVGIDLAKGDNKQAGIDAYKGVASFAIGKFGSSALQIGGVAFFIFDQTLTTFGNAAWAEREQAWRHVYRRYYASKEAEYRGTVTQQRNLIDRFRSIRARTSGGRSVNDWKVVASFYFKNARNPQKFEEYLTADIANYVAKFWDAPEFDAYAADGGWSTAGFARASSLTQAIKDKLEKEHASVITAMLIKKVLPEIQRKAIEEALQAEAKRLNGDWLKQQNDTVTVEVSAYDIKAPTRFEMILPNGGTWGGTIAPGEPRKLKITKIALTLAGFPDTIVLDGPSGREEQKFKLVNDMATVVFGAPASPTVSEFTRSETALDCVLTTTDADGQVSITTETRPAPPATPIDIGARGDGTMIMGRYTIAGGWKAASPGRYENYNMSFGAPYFENIETMDCDLSRKENDFYGMLAAQICKTVRTASEKGPNGEMREARCTSTMTLKLDGLYGPVEGAMIYTKIDPKFYEQLQKGYEQAIELQKSLPGGAGMQITDPNQIFGSKMP